MGVVKIFVNKLFQKNFETTFMRNFKNCQKNQLLFVGDVLATITKNMRLAQISQGSLEMFYLWRIKPKIPNV